jgi:hypothetical protein
VNRQGAAGAIASTAGRRFSDRGDHDHAIRGDRIITDADHAVRLSME